MRLLICYTFKAYFLKVMLFCQLGNYCNSSTNSLHKGKNVDNMSLTSFLLYHFNLQITFCYLILHIVPSPFLSMIGSCLGKKALKLFSSGINGFIVIPTILLDWHTPRSVSLVSGMHQPDKWRGMHDTESITGPVAW